MEEYQLQRPVPLPDSNQSGKLGAVGVGQTRRASSLDYKEIFGAVSACSIPVLDLPPAEDGLRFRHCSAMDYLDIFGGDDGCDFTVSYDELFASQVSGGMEAAPPPSAPGGDNDRGLRSIETSSPIENCNDLAGSSSNAIEKAVGDGNDDNTTRLSGSDDNSGNASNLVYEVKAKDPIHSDHGSNDLAQSADTSDDHVESKSDNSQSLLTNSIEKKVSTNTQSVNSEDFRENREHLPSSSQSSENEKLLNPSGGRHSRSSSTNSFSSLDQIYSSNTFLKVTDINLRTRPSKGLPPRRAPPARPPPARPPPKSDSNERTDHGAATSAMSYPSSEAPSFDAAASVAAMQEAMVVAQARLRSAKMSLERKRDGLQNRRKHSLSGDLSSMKRDDCEIEQEKVGEWKVEEQFFELIQGGKKFMNIPKDEMKQGENSEQTKDLKANEAVVDCLEKNQEEEGDHEVPARIELETKWRASKEAFICELGDRNHLQGSSILHKQRASKISEHLETTVEEMKMSHYLEDDELRAKPEVLSKANVVDETEGPGKAEKKLPQEEPVLISLPHSDVCSLTSDECPQETDVSGEGAGEEIERGDQCHVAFGKGEHLENGGGQVCGDCDDRGNDLSVKKVEREQVIKSGVEEEGDEEAERVRKKVEEDNRRERLMLEEEERLRRQLEEEEKRERTKLEAEERERRRIEEERERERRLQEEKEEREKRRPEQEESVKERPVVDEGEGMMRRKSGEVEEREGSKVEEDRSGSSEKVELEGRKQEERVRGRWKIEEERLKFRKLEGTMEGQEKQKDKRRTEKEIERERRKIEEESEMDEKERERRMLEEEREREREREKDRQAAERAAQEANERAFAEARERAEKAAARIRAERAAAQKAAAEKAAQEGRVLGDKSSTTPAPSRSEKAGGSEVGESAIRSRARMERHQRTVERAARALAEKNMRDVITQREQTERSRLAEALDAEIRRWSSGKEGNLRALLSTLQYILGPESGWQPVPLTEVLTAQAVKKAYRKATLCVHPDKLQQRGASIQHKYICEKVFDLLKEAWSRFNSEER